MRLYWCRKFKNRRESGLLLQLALKDYIKEQGIITGAKALDSRADPMIMIDSKSIADSKSMAEPMVMIDSKSMVAGDVEIFKGKDGKPYTNIPDLYFNISHSQDLWVCGVSNRHIGVDVEILRDRKYEKLMERYFQPEEIIYVKEYGIKGFFEIWTFKEAHSKLLGESIFKNIGLSAVDNGKIRELYRLNEKESHIRYQGSSQANWIMEPGETGQLKDVVWTLAKMVESPAEEIQVELKEINLQ